MRRPTGASVHNLPGRRTAISEVVELIGAPGVSFDDVPLPLPEESDSSSFTSLVPGFAETPLADGVEQTMARFRELLAAGLVSAPAG